MTFRPVTFFVAAVLSAAPVRASAAPDAAPDPAVAFVKAHCLDCHAGDKPKGDLRLDDAATADFSDRATRERWQLARERLSAGDMPPKAKPRPPADGVEAFAKWVDAKSAPSVAAQRAAEGRVVLRRLNRVEYENTIRDLLGIDLVGLKEMLPEDASADGFDNVGAALHTSSFLLERYLAAGDAALNEAITNGPRPPSALKRYRVADQHQVKSTTERVFRHDGETVVAFTSSAWQAVGLSQFYPSLGGRYRFRVSASAAQSKGEPVTFRVWAGGGGMGGAKGHLVGYFDAPAAGPKVFEFVERMEPRTSLSILPYGLVNAQTVAKVGADTWDGPGLAIDWIEVEGPLNDVWPPESYRRIFGDLRQKPAPTRNRSDRVEVTSDDPKADARRVLARFAERAFRRPVTDGEIGRYVELVEAKMTAGRSFEQALRAGLLAILVSPDFLFLRETRLATTAAPAMTRPATGVAVAAPALDDYALASRLSYFLWSTMPDDALLAAAARGDLRRPGELRAQVERMLAHPKAEALARNFVGQWLGMRDIDFTVPSHILYPDFDEMLKASMPLEAELFFAEVLRADLSVTNFVASDFSVLNGRLAKHYGIAGVSGWEFRRVSLPPGSHRGGALTMAGVLKVTANGTNTSPVTRGAWVLDRILGTPPPRPPPNVPAVDPDIRGATTIREQLAKHRDLPACAGCHAKIDPPGFALESFDVIGGWRENYRTTGRGKPVTVDGRRMPYLSGPAVDPTGVLPDGRAFKDVDGLKQLLLTDKEQLARSLAAKLMTYATGGPPEPADRAEIEAIVKRSAAKDYGLRTLVHEVVQSELFRTK